MEENRKLQNEVQELRAFSLSPQFSAQMIPPTIHTKCRSCGHFAVPSSAAISSVCPTTTKAEPPQVHTMSAITMDSISTCGPPKGLDGENQRVRTLFLWFLLYMSMSNCSKDNLVLIQPGAIWKWTRRFQLSVSSVHMSSLEVYRYVVALTCFVLVALPLLPSDYIIVYFIFVCSELQYPIVLYRS